MAVTAPDEAEDPSGVQLVAHEVARDCTVDAGRGVLGLAAAVDAHHLGHRLHPGVGGVRPVGRNRAARGVVGDRERRLPGKGVPELIGGRRLRVQRAQDLALVLEVDDVSVTVEPARPLVPEQGDEAAGFVESTHLAGDLFPHLGMRVEEPYAEVVVIRQDDQIEAGDVARVVEVVRGYPRSVGEIRMSVEIPPVDGPDPRDATRNGFDSVAISFSPSPKRTRTRNVPAAPASSSTVVWPRSSRASGTDSGSESPGGSEER